MRRPAAGWLVRATTLALAGFTAFAAQAHADPTEDDSTVAAGVQSAPPVLPAAPVLHQELDGRRAVRGCAVGATCVDDASSVLHEFEVSRFPPPGTDPWIGERTPSTRSHLEAGPNRVVSKPSELRPDAPWLDSLAMPDIPMRWSQRLADYLVFYKEDPRGRNIMKGWLVAQGRYKDMILTNLRKAKLPEDLLYVAMIESSYDPADSSGAGALGLWQFMPEGSTIYGLRRDRWVDERRDPLRSTIAQMDYFKDLFQRFGEWHLALAAFNVGYGAVLKSIARYNTNDYYQLCEYENAIPWETCWYSPKVMAAAIVGRNRAAFGFDKLEVLPAEQWDEVAVPGSISLGIIARAAGASVEEIQRLNPQLQRGRTPPGEVGYVVRVPVGKRAESERRLAELQSQWDGYDAYVVAHGERFEDVATTFGCSTSTLKKLNDVQHESEVQGGTVLVVPRISAEARAKNQARAKSKLMASGIDAKEGESLLVPVPDKDVVVKGKRRVFYRVVTGDTLRTVAAAFGVERSELIAWNGLDTGAAVHPKMVLMVWVAPKFDADKHRVALLDEAVIQVVTRGSAEHMDLAEERTGRVRLEYVATRKEKLEDIAKRYGMGSHDLARINRISYDRTLEKGDKIIVYLVVDPSRSERAEAQWKATPKARRGKTAGTAPATSTASLDADAKPKAAAGVTPATHDGHDGHDAHDVPTHTDHPAADADSAADESGDANDSGPVTSPSHIR